MSGSGDAGDPCLPHGELDAGGACACDMYYTGSTCDQLWDEYLVLPQQLMVVLFTVAYGVLARKAYRTAQLQRVAKRLLLVRVSGCTVALRWTYILLKSRRLQPSTDHDLVSLAGTGSLAAAIIIAVRDWSALCAMLRPKLGRGQATTQRLALVALVAYVVLGVVDALDSEEAVTSRQVSRSALLAFAVFAAALLQLRTLWSIVHIAQSASRSSRTAGVGRLRVFTCRFLGASGVMQVSLVLAAALDVLDDPALYITFFYLFRVVECLFIFTLLDFVHAERGGPGSSGGHRLPPPAGGRRQFGRGHQGGVPRGHPADAHRHQQRVAPAADGAGAGGDTPAIVAAAAVPPARGAVRVRPAEAATRVRFADEDGAAGADGTDKTTDAGKAGGSMYADPGRDAGPLHSSEPDEV